MLEDYLLMYVWVSTTLCVLMLFIYQFVEWVTRVQNWKKELTELPLAIISAPFIVVLFFLLAPFIIALLIYFKWKEQKERDAFDA